MANTAATVRETFDYCLLVLKRAWLDFCEVFGLNLATIGAALFYGLVLLWRYRALGRPVMIEEWASWKAYLWEGFLPPTLITAAVIASLFIAKAAAGLHKEQEDKIPNSDAGRPKLTGFFQGFQVYSYGEDTEVLSDDKRALIFVPGFENPLGVEVILKFRMVNENPTPTTLYNFSLKMTYYEQEGFAAHADEWVYDGMSEKERAILFEQNERRFADNEEAEKRCPNLVNYLRAHEMVQGKGLAGGLVFRFPGIKWVQGEVGDRPNLILKLGVEDSWGAVHYIEKWGPRAAPLPRRVKPPFW